MDNFLIYEEIHKRDSCVVYRGRIKRSIDFVMIYCVDKYKRHELSNLVRINNFFFFFFDLYSNSSRFD